MKTFKGMKLNWNFQRGGEGGVWIFSGTTQCDSQHNFFLFSLGLPCHL